MPAESKDVAKLLDFESSVKVKFSRDWPHCLEQDQAWIEPTLVYFIERSEFYKYLDKAPESFPFLPWKVKNGKTLNFESSIEILRELRLLYKMNQLKFTSCLILI